jgi:hypothetical protein
MVQKIFARMSGQTLRIINMQDGKKSTIFKRVMSLLWITDKKVLLVTAALEQDLDSFLAIIDHIKMSLLRQHGTLVVESTLSTDTLDQLLLMFRTL